MALVYGLGSPSGPRGVGFGVVPNPPSNQVIGSPRSSAPMPTYVPGIGNMTLPGAGYVGFSSGDDVNKYETKATNVFQRPTNVWEGARSEIPFALSNYIQGANAIAAYNPALQNLYQNTGFQGGQALQRALIPGGGIDYLGRLGIAEGMNNIRQQQAAGDRTLQAQLGRNAGNQSLINVLQNQNNFRSQLAMQPLFTEAQRGSYERAAGNIGLNNQQIAAQNQALALMNQVNNQNQLNTLQARLSALQPQQNLLEALNAFQSQARGLESSEGVFAGKNFS